LLAVFAGAPALAQSPNDDISVAARTVNAATFSYPAKSRRQEEQGTVVLKLRVLKSGDLGELSVHRTSGYSALDEAALADARRLKFEPARNKAGDAVASTIFLPVAYRLRENQVLPGTEGNRPEAAR
jgi:TonB family protein